MSTIVFSVLIFTLLYNSGAAYPHYQDVRITEFRVKAPIAEGGTALLGCNFNMGDDTLYGVQWSKDGQVFYRYVQLEDKSMVFYLPGVNVDVSRSTQNFLTLRHFTRESAGVYRCEVFAHGPRFNVVHREVYVAANPPRTCTTEDGYSGLCVTHNLCSSSSEYGAGVFDARISQSETSCPVPLICCKGEDPVNQQIEPFTYKNDPKTPAEAGNHPQAVACTIRGEQIEEAGECVPQHLCGEGRTIIEDGIGIIGPRTLSDNCPPSTVCCKIPDNNEPKDSSSPSLHQNQIPQTDKDQTSQARDNYPPTVTCTISEEQGYVSGECVPRHLCGEGRTIIEDGIGIIGPRTLSDNCPPSTVCCKIPDKNESKESSSPSLSQNQIPQTAKDQTSQARDNYPPTVTCTISEEQGYVSGECVPRHLCGEGRTIIEDGIGIIGPRTLSDNCPPSTVCCKIPDNNEPKDSSSPSLYQNQLPQTDKDQTSQARDNYPPTVTCTISEERGYVTGECVPRHLCGERRTIIEDGIGIIGPRTLSDNCPPSTVCCKIPDNNEPKDSSSPSVYQNQIPQTDKDQTSQARDNYPPTVTCTISEEQGYVSGECVPRHLCGKGRTIIEDGIGIIGPRTLSDNCPPSTVCCKIPDNNEPKDSSSPSVYQNQIQQTAKDQTSQARDNYPPTVTCTISEEQGYVSGECVQRHLCGPGRTINEYGEGIIGPRTLSDNCPPSTVCCKIPDNIEPKDSASPSENQNVISPTAANHPETVSCTIPEGQRDVTGKCGNGRDNSASRINNKRKNPANPNNYQNQLETPTAEIGKPQTLSCKTRDGSSGECVQNYLCDRKSNFVITDGEGIIDARMEDDCPTPMVCCKVPDDNEHNNTASRGNNNSDSDSGIADGNNEKANPNIYQNQHKTPTEEVIKPLPLSCKTRDGSSGECVQNYLCDRQTNFAITDGKDLIDARMEEDGCPAPMVCCKVPDDNEHNNNAGRVNNNNDSGNGAANDNNNKNRANPNNYQNQHKTPTEEEKKPQLLSCKTRDGSSGECVQNYLCDKQTNFAVTDGKDLIDARMEEDGCPVPMVCCKVPDDNEHNNTASRGNNKNDSGNGAADDNNNKNRAYPNNYQNQHKPPIAVVANPPLLSCKTRDGSSGECVLNYLCDRETNFAVTDGKDIIDARMEDDGADCPVPMVCCKVPDKNGHEDFASSVKDNRADPTNPSIYQYHTETLTQEAEQPQKTLETPDRLNFDAPAINYLKQPSIYHLKEQRSRPNLNLHSTHNLNLPLTQAPIYPYIRVPRDLTRPGCGWRNPNGVNVTGSDAPIHLEPNQAKPGEFPWTVSVMNFTRRVGNAVNFEYLGSGALIHERVVLTAAHIFDGRNAKTNLIPFYVTVGDYDQKGYKFLPRKAIKVENVVVHENYNMDFNFNDFALVFLQKPVLPSGHVNYICLPPPDHVDPTGARCATSGWGKDGHDVHQFVMSTAELPIVDHTNCQNLHRSVRNLGPGFILDQSFMCAGESGVDSCKGSGGAPLACPMENVPDRYILSGLVSWSNNCSLDSRPSVFARVAGARQWIDDKMAAHSYRIPTD